MITGVYTFINEKMSLALVNTILAYAPRLIQQQIGLKKFVVASVDQYFV